MKTEISQPQTATNEGRLPAAYDVDEKTTGSVNPIAEASAALRSLIEQNAQLLGAWQRTQQELAALQERPLKAALERKRLDVIADLPTLAKDKTIELSRGSYSTIDTNTIRYAITPLLKKHGITYTVTPMGHSYKEVGNQYLYTVKLQCKVTDTTTGYSEVIGGENFGMHLGTMDKGYASAVTNGTGKFLLNYFCVAVFDDPTEYNIDEDGHLTQPTGKKKSAAATASSTNANKMPGLQKTADDAAKLAHTNAARQIFAKINDLKEVSAKKTALMAANALPEEAITIAHIERYYQLADLDLSEEKQLKAVNASWNGVIYGSKKDGVLCKIYLKGGEVEIRDADTYENLKALKIFKEDKSKSN